MKKISIGLVGFLIAVASANYPAARTSVPATAAVPILAFNNDKLEQGLEQIWTTFLNNLLRYIQSDEADRLTNLEGFILPAIRTSVDAAPIREMITNPASTATFREQLVRMLSTVAQELLNKNSSDDGIHCIEGILRFIIFIDALFANNEAQREALIKFLTDLQTALRQYLEDSNHNTLSKAMAAALPHNWSNSSDMQQFTDIVSQLNMCTSPSIPSAVIKTRIGEVNAIITILIKNHSTTPNKRTILFIDRIKRAVKLLFSHEKELAWCGCKPTGQRVALALRLINDSNEQYPNKETRLHYVSLAAGELLQDYIIIRELQAQGHTNLDIHLIDPILKDAYAIEAMISDPQIQEFLLDQALNNTHRRALFAKKIGALFTWTPATLANRPTYEKTLFQPGTYVTVYDHEYEYTRFVTHNPELKANIVMLIDPALMPLYPTKKGQGNIMAITKKGAAPLSTIRLAPLAGGPEDLPTLLDEDEEDEEEYERAFLKKPTILCVLASGTGIEMYSNITDPSMSFGIRIKKIAHDLETVVRETGMKTAALAVQLMQQVQPFAAITWMSDVYVSFHNILSAGVADPRKTIVYTLDVIGETSKDSVNKINASRSIQQPALPLWHVRNLKKKYNFDTTPFIFYRRVVAPAAPDTFFTSPAASAAAGKTTAAPTTTPPPAAEARP